MCMCVYFVLDSSKCQGGKQTKVKVNDPNAARSYIIDMYLFDYVVLSVTCNARRD